MKKRLAILACRRQELLGEIAAQRMEAAEITRHWKIPLALFDTGLRAVRFMNNHPAFLASGVVALLPLHRNGLVSMVQKSWRLFCLYPSILVFATKYISLANFTRWGRNIDH